MWLEATHQRKFRRINQSLDVACQVALHINNINSLAIRLKCPCSGQIPHANNRPLYTRANYKLFSYFSTETYFVGTQKNFSNEKVL